MVELAGEMTLEPLDCAGGYSGAPGGRAVLPEPTVDVDNTVCAGGRRPEGPAGPLAL